MLYISSSDIKENRKKQYDMIPVWVFQFFNHIVQIIPRTSQQSRSNISMFGRTIWSY